MQIYHCIQQECWADFFVNSVSQGLLIGIQDRTKGLRITDELHPKIMKKINIFNFNDFRS